MARLRSAVAKAKEVSKEAATSLAANISETGSSLLKSPQHNLFSRKEAQPSARSQLPVLKTPIKTPTREVSYPSLDQLTSEMMTPRPKTGSTIPTPAPPKTAARKPIVSCESPSPVKKSTTPAEFLKPTAPKDKPLPATPSHQDDPSSKMPGAFSIPKSFDFKSPTLTNFQVKSQAFLSDLKNSASNPILPPPSTPRRTHPGLGVAATTGGKRDVKDRFHAAHAAAFAKMDSIASHYAARRTPQTTVKTPQNPQKGLKRTKCHASPTKSEDNVPLSSPSPVKKLPQAPPSKRQRTDPASTTASTTIGTASAASSTRSRFSTTNTATRRMGAHASRRLSGRKPLPALPQPSIRMVNNQNLTLVPPTTTSSSSTIPVTPSRLRLQHPHAPHTIAPSLFPTAPSHPPGTISPFRRRLADGATPVKSAITDFTFKARAKGHSSFKRLSDMHERALTKSSAPVAPTPLSNRILVEEATEIDDPFAAPVRDAARKFNLKTLDSSLCSPKKLAERAEKAVRRAEQALSANTAARAGVKRRAAESPEKLVREEPVVEETEEEKVDDAEVEKVLQEVLNENPPPPAPPAETAATGKRKEAKMTKTPVRDNSPRKRMRFDGDAKVKEAKEAVKKGAAKVMSRLDALATPKRRNEKGVQAVQSARAAKVKAKLR